MMRGDAGVKLKTLHADGGPTRNKFLMQFTADITRTELKVSEVTESSAWGAVLNGLLGLALRRSLAELAALTRESKSFKPKMKAALATQNHAGWKRAVHRVL